MRFLTYDTLSLESLLAGPWDPSWGAVATFSGVVRNQNEGRRVRGLEYTAYTELAEKDIARIIESVKANTGVQEVRVLHRLGPLGIGDTAVLVAAFSPHRAAAFQACQEVIDRIKETTPIWKREQDGDSFWDWPAPCSQVRPEARSIHPSARS